MYKYGFRLPSILFEERYGFSSSQVELWLILFSMHACLIISNHIIVYESYNGKCIQPMLRIKTCRNPAYLNQLYTILSIRPVAYHPMLDLCMTFFCWRFIQLLLPCCSYAEVSLSFSPTVGFLRTASAKVNLYLLGLCHLLLLAISTAQQEMYSFDQVISTQAI